MEGNCWKEGRMNRVEREEDSKVKEGSARKQREKERSKE